jgi:hypothetical protein
MKKALFLVLVVAMVFAVAAPAFASTGVFGSPQAVKLTVLPTIKASVHGANGAAWMDLGDWAAYGKPAGTSFLDVSSNCAFTSSAVLSDLVSGTNTIPAASFDVTGLGAGGPAGGAGVEIPISVSYKTTLPMDVLAGEYAGTLTVTVTAS